MNKFLSIFLGTTVISLLYVMIADATAHVDMEVIYFIESSNNPKAYNKNSHAVGLGQITPIVLKEWNNFHKVQLQEHDLYDEQINRKVSDWYMNTRIPAMIKHFKKSDNVINRLICYNAGIDYIVHEKAIPAETQNYIEKYFSYKLTD